MQRSYGIIIALSYIIIISKYGTIFNLFNELTNIYPLEMEISWFFGKYQLLFPAAMPSRFCPLQEKGAMDVARIPLPALSPPLSLLKLKDKGKRLPSLLRLERHHD